MRGSDEKAMAGEAEELDHRRWLLNASHILPSQRAMPMFGTIGCRDL